jgi:hypothetical protein
LVVVPTTFAFFLHRFAQNLKPSSGFQRYGSMYRVFYDVESSWTSWLLMSALLLAALLLFFRAKGYQLLRRPRSPLASSR